MDSEKVVTDPTTPAAHVRDKRARANTDSAKERKGAKQAPPARIDADWADALNVEVRSALAQCCPPEDLEHHQVHLSQLLAPGSPLDFGNYSLNCRDLSAAQVSLECR